MLLKIFGYLLFKEVAHISLGELCLSALYCFQVRDLVVVCELFKLYFYWRVRV